MPSKSVADDIVYVKVPSKTVADDILDKVPSKTVAVYIQCKSAKQNCSTEAMTSFIG